MKRGLARFFLLRMQELLIEIANYYCRTEKKGMNEHEGET